MKGSIGRRMFLSNFIVIFITISLFEVVFGLGVRKFYYGGTLRILNDKALSSANFYNLYLKYEDIEGKASTILENYREQDEAELQIVDVNGNIIMSSTGFKHNEKVDISFKNNLKLGEISVWKGKISLTNEDVMAVSTPLVQGDTIVGFLRLVSSIEDINGVVNNLLIKALALGGFMLIVSSLLTIILSTTIVSPIKHLTDVSRKIAEGDFDVVANKKYNDEIGQLTDTLNFMSEEIRKSNNLKNDFISSISHELRTPLTSIRGWAETINGGQVGDDETKQGIRIILRESERLTKLVEELLNFSRFESGRINMNFEKVDLNFLIMDVLKQFMIRFEEKNIKVSTNLDEKITYVNGDEDRLRQVFINIIENSCKFSHQNGEINVSTEYTPKGARVCIEDNGIGIPSNQISNITEKFFKGDSNKSGSGLGLYICKEIVELHKGTLHVNSCEGKGTSAIIELIK